MGQCRILQAALIVGALSISIQMVPAEPADAIISLAGSWRFALDEADAGIKEEWFLKDMMGRIQLPGALQSQDYGSEIGTETPWVLSLYDRFWYLREDYKAYAKPPHVKVPFLSQPPRHYLGAAWYQRDIDIPPEWRGRRITLSLERPHWESTVWVDDRKTGTQLSLVAPHEYDLAELAPGHHRLSIRIDNRMLLPYRPDAHSVSDSLGGSWNGIAGKIELASTSAVWIDDAQVFSDPAGKTARIQVTIANSTGRAGMGVLIAGDMSMPVKWDGTGTRVEMEIALAKNARAWDEFHPVLQHLTLRLIGEQADDRRELTYGVRALKTEGNQFVLNGRPVLFRGTHHGGDFPLTGFPPTDVAYWKRIIRICQAWGLNHMRFHSWCPPDAAFAAADELGFYLQPEAGMWNEISPGSDMEKMMYAETERMIRAYGNHPSFMLLSPSNEPAGRWKEALPKWVERFRREDPRKLYTTGTGWSLIDTPGPVSGADYLAVHRIGPNMLRRESGWFGRDYRQSLSGVNVPVLSHEIGQWCAYPDYDVINKFTGYMRPGNYEIFRDSLAAHDLTAKNKDFAWASGRFQMACYKEEIEANLRTPGLSGFQLLDLHDYLGQGTALVGLLDAFWETKGYVAAEEFRRFCGTTVPLARLQSRVFTTADAFAVEAEIAHFGAQPIVGAVATWQIKDSRNFRIAGGQFAARTIPLGKNIPLGSILVDLAKLTAPARYRLVIGLRGTLIENSWDFWLYPPHRQDFPQGDILVTDSWNLAEARLSDGGKVLLRARPEQLSWASPPLDTLPIFWNGLMTPSWKRMLGLWIDARHPALVAFPTEANSDWQWTQVMQGMRAINMDSLPKQLQPMVQPIDDWNRNHRLGLIFECRIGPGRLMVCSANLDSSPAAPPVALQLRRSLIEYMNSTRFQPKVAASVQDLRGLFFDTQIMKRLGATASANAVPVNPAANVLDGDPNTYWLAGGKGAHHPHELTLQFPGPVSMSGLLFMPRQNHREHEGDIREYAILVSDDGSQWQELLRGELVSTFAPQQVRFAERLTTRHLRIRALSGFGTDPTAALAEVAPINDDAGWSRFGGNPLTKSVGKWVQWESGGRQVR
jgi:beta-galactosidase